MRYRWDLFRWRFVAIYGTIKWYFIGAPMTYFPGFNRKQVISWTFDICRAKVMYRHEKDKYISGEEFIKRLRELTESES